MWHLVLETLNLLTTSQSKGYLQEVKSLEATNSSKRINMALVKSTVCFLFFLSFCGVDVQGLSSAHSRKARAAINTNLVSQNGYIMGCNTGWTLVKNACYKVRNTSPLTHFNAEKECQSVFGAKLASVSVNDANELATALLADEPDASKYWIAQEVTSKFCQYLKLSSIARDDCNKEMGYICQRNLVNIQTGCPQDTYALDNRCFSIFSVEREFDAAQAYCERQNGSLATVNNKETLEFLALELFHSLGSYSAWIGLYKGADNVYKWKSGDKVLELQWNEDHTGMESPRCITTISGFSAFTFHPTLCRFFRPFICEYPSAAQSHDSTSVPKVKLAECPAGWESYGEFCYKASVESLPWNQSRSHCHALGGDLVSLHSPEEASFIKDEFLSKREHQTFWLGLHHDEALDESAQWSDGTPFDYSNLLIIDTWSNSCDVEINPSTMEWACIENGGPNPYICKLKREAQTCSCIDSD
ncbi:hypothetical protein RRG08_045821 [Elysia crispata]|uniref:C-type lectin domain-containing protein n=1 Tax=Elysia crispata TaxID=231223 RepID=A0AAE0Z0C8_9GAST|nr:hypothetical protein RRG08_045821 [Elysia crispata]